MDLLTLVFVLISSLLIGLVVFTFLYDADLTTILCEKLGVDIRDNMKDKVVWITGASTGIGASLAKECLKNGSKVIISARRESLLEKVKANCLKDVPDAKPADVLVLPFDMCDIQCHGESFAKVLEAFGKLDILINNAGMSQRARWEHTNMEVDKNLFQLNVFSVVSLARTVLPHMLDRKSGTLAVTSSTCGKAGVPFSGTYTGSKHALHGYFESLRNEKVGSGIEICMLCPGPTFSSLLEVAATEKAGEKFGETMSSTDKRMTGERCAQLSLVAIANRLPESWICFFPVLPLMYASQYLPSVSKTLMKIIGPKFLAKVRDSRNAMESDKYK